MNDRLEQLKQLITTTWDGNLISKTYRDEFVKIGWVSHTHGFNFLTNEGVKILIALGELKT